MFSVTLSKSADFHHVSLPSPANRMARVLVSLKITHDWVVKHVKALLTLMQYQGHVMDLLGKISARMGCLAG